MAKRYSQHHQQLGHSRLHNVIRWSVLHIQGVFFEHDYHYVRTHELSNKWHGKDRTVDEIKSCKFSSKKMLSICGYKLLFEDVSFHEDYTGITPHPWEDLWINPMCFKYEHLVKLDYLSGKNMHFKDCVDRIVISTH